MVFGARNRSGCAGAVARDARWPWLSGGRSSLSVPAWPLRGPPEGPGWQTRPPVLYEVRVHHRSLALDGKCPSDVPVASR